jgi:glycogen synthase
MRVPDHKLVTIYNGIDYDLWDRSLVSSQDTKDLRKSLELDNHYV